MKIYTKHGDDGYTNLNGNRVPKDHDIIRVMGPIDECNGFIGLACSVLSNDNGFPEVKEQLHKIQFILSDLCAALVKKKIFDEQHIKNLESWIDYYAPDLLPIKSFTIPDGQQAAVSIYLARTACRKAERRVCPLLRSSTIPKNILIFLNRLSDYLHVIELKIGITNGQKP